jgi:hypothetical protein
MRMNKITTVVKYGAMCGATLAFAVTLTGCAGPAQQQASTPPHLVASKGVFAKTYNRTRAFGPVPPALEAKGETACEDAGLGKLEGYHSRAEYSNRVPAPGGGFLCDQPPPLIDQNAKA